MQHCCIYYLNFKNMKTTSLLLLSALTLSQSFAQETDTLKNFSGPVSLEAGKYSGADWGFYAGHNSKEQQQFGEKYLVDEHVHVLGVVAHLATSTGTVTNPHLEIDFRLWNVDAATGKPAGNASIEEGHLHLEDANLGGPTLILFHNETHVEDAFFVTMDLGDYAHDGLSGDTVGLYYAPHGTRTAADISATPFRNVFQAHSHGTPNWRDFYTQFTTPAQLATHLALYPVVEMESHTGLGKVAKNGLQLNSPFPNPAGNELILPFQLQKQSRLSFQIMDLSGRILSSIDKGIVNPGEHLQKFDLSNLAAGTYILSVIGQEAAIGIRFNKY